MEGARLKTMENSDHDTNPQKDKKTITNLYGMFAASIIMQFIPMMIMQGFGLVLFIVVMIAAYIYRIGKDKQTLIWNHMTYVIGTIWISSTMLAIGTAIGGYVMYMNGDNTAFHTMTQQILNGVALTESQVMAVFKNYMNDNMGLLVITGIVSIGPGVAYLIYRFFKGLERAMKGARLANPKSWL